MATPLVITSLDIFDLIEIESSLNVAIKNSKDVIEPVSKTYSDNLISNLEGIVGKIKKIKTDYDELRKKEQEDGKKN